MKTKTITDGVMSVTIEKIDAIASEAYDKDRNDKIGYAKFLFVLTVTVLKDIVYIPTSIGSGRVSTGFVYYIEGDESGTGTASIKSEGDTPIVTAGTIKYSKIMPGKTARFKLSVHVSGIHRKSYKVGIGRVNYKFNPNDPRYKRFLTEISTEAVRLK